MADRQQLVLRLLLCVVLGTVTTVCVAWACSLWVVVPGVERASGVAQQMQLPDAWRAEVARLPEVTPGGYAESSLSLRFKRSEALGRTVLNAIRSAPGDGVDDAFESRSGWPMRCLWCASSDGTRKPGVVWERALLVPDRLAREGASFTYFDGTLGKHPLPIGMIGNGLAANTAFYGAVWVVPVFGIPALRRWRRRRRGRCVGCGYELAGLATCPECGRIAGPLTDGLGS